MTARKGLPYFWVPAAQDKLHQNLCRQRSLVSVGTHDLATLQVQPPFCSQPCSHPMPRESLCRTGRLREHLRQPAPSLMRSAYAWLPSTCTVFWGGGQMITLPCGMQHRTEQRTLRFCLCGQGPFSYEALPPSDITFVPLKQTREFRADALLQVRPCHRSCTPASLRMAQHLCQACLKDSSICMCILHAAVTRKVDTGTWVKSWHHPALDLDSCITRRTGTPALHARQLVPRSLAEHHCRPLKHRTLACP